MKPLYLLLILLVTSFAVSAQVPPNMVIVKGYITSTNGSPVANWPVYIAPDSSTTSPSCMQYHTVYTNPNGYYSDTLYCTSAISQVRITTYNCNVHYISHDPMVPTTRVVESNFTICSPPPVCMAAFSSSTSGSTAYFSNLSTGSSGSVITQFYWYFGDGSSSAAMSPVHTYTASGTYSVKLIILGSNGCRDSVVHNIVISVATGCHASFTDSVSNKYGFFYSGSSTTATGDSIVERHWNFGDPNSTNNTLGGNAVNAYHIYANNGTYNVCLTTTTRSGCRDTVCHTITINSIQNTCSSSFTFTKSGSAVTFNSSSSHAASGDSIIRRKWYFGDTDTLGGNVISPVHTYAIAGNYQVCLTIWTAAGCEKNICQQLSIIDTSCYAYFTFTQPTSVPATVSFNSSGSSGSIGGTITTRIWSFGDGDTARNNIDPQHTYTTPGTYNVCLTIYTSNGCHSSVCHTVVIAGQSCQSYFTANISTTNNHLVLFNSNSSSPANSITSRTWTFGDGDSLNGNVASPQHVYANLGTYTVCLKITTSTGCTSTLCKTVVIANHCKARFTVNPSPTVPPGGNAVLFNSSTSEGVQGDSIIQRTWHFGNAGYLGGNVVSPVYTFPAPGTYYVCLEILTASGCSDSTCTTVQVPLQTQSVCHPVFYAGPSILNNHLFVFNSANSYSVPASTIITRVWSFGDGDTLRGNIIDPQHLYANAGTYTVCLRIVSANGCEATTCKTITITPAHCQAKLTVTGSAQTSGGYEAHFNSNIAMAVAGDSITERIWHFGDGGSLGGNVVAPTHIYTVSGLYTACLIIRTHSGCSDTACIQVQATANQNHCFAHFAFATYYTTVRLLGNYSTTSPGDSIITRSWSFGDSTYLTGNISNPSHTYTRPGTYTICLKITTAAGCQSTECRTVTVTSVPVTCIPRFTYQKLAPRSIQFNSQASWISANDSIVARKWTFGDGSPLLAGNVINPVHNYLVNGVYNVCLKITTRLGCENTVCSPVRAVDSSNVVDTTDPIRIILLAPNPAVNQFSTVVWSKHNNVNAQFAIYDIYGVKKWSINKVLTQGMSITTIPTYFLLPGPYFLRVTTLYGIQSRKFYKL